VEGATVRPANLPAPISDAETSHALALLQRYPSGLTRADLSRYFQSDRRGRDVMAALCERGIAPVITAPSRVGDGKVYRLARNVDEVRAAAHQLRSYIRSLERRVTGLELAWDRGAQAPQPDLFESPLEAT
jgi:hypothetical protein